MVVTRQIPERFREEIDRPAEIACARQLDEIGRKLSLKCLKDVRAKIFQH